MVSVFGKVFFYQFVFAVVTVAKDEGNVVLCGKSLYPSAEMSGKSHQMGVVEGIIITVKHTPPGAESAAAVQQWIISIDDDAIDAIVSSVEQMGIIVGELIGHSVQRPVKADSDGSY